MKVLEKIHDLNRFNPICRKETIERILNININKLTDEQTKMICELYLENLKDGLKPKEAMTKAFEIITCFKI